MAFENMGNEQLVYFSFGKSNNYCKKNITRQFRANQEKGIIFSKNNIIYFDEANWSVII